MTEEAIDALNNENFIQYMLGKYNARVNANIAIQSSTKNMASDTRRGKASSTNYYFQKSEYGFEDAEYEENDDEDDDEEYDDEYDEEYNDDKLLVESSKPETVSALTK
jgi:hypothetical protein